MIKTIGTLTAAEMLAEIDAIEPAQEEVDAEWKTREEWELVLGKGQSTTGRLIRKAVKAGLMELARHRRNSLRGLYPTLVYRWTGKPNQSPPAPKSAKRSRG